jgi:hypothetical protein
MFNSYEMTQALVADRQSSFRREARNRRLVRLVRSERRHPHPAQSGNQAA